jgi:hypothetical protein
MLEILFLIKFTRHLAKMAREKGRSGGWAGLGVAFWIGGELIGFIVGSLADAGAGAYLVALLFAAFGATAAYFVVKSLGGQVAPEPFAVPAGGGALPPVGPPPDLQNPYAPPRTR